jgi:hypothetical protein
MLVYKFYGQTARLQTVVSGASSTVRSKGDVRLRKSHASSFRKLVHVNRIWEEEEVEEEEEGE